eukprot:6299126-Heterocapsa_arctica.AAC.1
MGWDKAAVEQLIGVPWAWSGEAREVAREAVFRDRPADDIPDADPPMPAPIPRQLKITTDMLEKSGSLQIAFAVGG